MIAACASSVFTAQTAGRFLPLLSGLISESFIQAQGLIFQFFRQANVGLDAEDHLYMLRQPTSQLPPIKLIPSSSIDVLQSTVDYIRRVYIPPVRGSLRRNKRTNFFPRVPSEPNVNSQESWHWDIFDRDYAVRWLTAVITYHGSSNHDDDDQQEDDLQPDDRHENLINSAASLLAICAGTASAGMINRTFVFETYHPMGPQDEQATSCALTSSIVIELTDIPLDNTDYRSVGGQTWGSACILADMIAENPASFGIPGFSSSPKSELPFSFRCIELGAGTGLVSLLIGKLLGRQCSRHLPRFTGTRLTDLLTKAEIVATDYYPSVLENLQKNVRANFADNIPIEIHCQWLDWSVFSTSASTSDPPLLQERFDVVYGADVIYEPFHAQWIKDSLVKLLKKPSKSTAEIDDPAFHLIIPLRRAHVVISNTVEQVFRTAIQNGPEGPGTCDELFIKERKTIIGDSESSMEEIKYVYYKIGWGVFT